MVADFLHKNSSGNSPSGGGWLRGERAQLQTLEGFAAALLMVGTVYLAVTAVTLSVPQTELHIDAQLKTYGRDALAILDAQIPPENEEEYYTSSLKNSVVGWMNGVEGATNWETEEFEPSNPGTNQTSYRFEFAGPPLGNISRFNVSIPNNTRISHAYVTLTGMPLLDMGTTTTVPPTRYELENPNTTVPDHFGCSIAHGDVNDDGVSDLIVGAYGNNSSSGVVYVYYGNESGISAWKDDGPNVTIINPGVSGDCFGWAVACGDVDNDTVDDVIVGAPENDTNSDSKDTGVVYIYYGSASPLTHPDATIFNPRGATHLGGFGHSLSCGDVDGDNDTDLLIGAPTVDGDGNAFVYYGVLSGDYGHLNHSVRLHGSTSNEFFGVSVACVDINKDGKSDIVIGANVTNQTYVRFGGESLPIVIDASDEDEVNLTLSGESGSGFGFSVSSAGDVNKDGTDDLIVGAPDKATAHIFYGGSLLDDTSDINLTGTSDFGMSVSSAGDVDSDGYAGVVVGIPNSTNAFVYYDVDLGIGQIELSGASGSEFGSVVSEIGDVDDDGIPDIAVGAPDDSSGAGKVYVYTPRFPETPWFAVGNTTDLANGNGTKVWEYTTVIKTDNSNCKDGDDPPNSTSKTVGNSANKTIPIYREITTDVNLSMYVMTTGSTIKISVNGVEVYFNESTIDTGGNWIWYDNITLPGDITEWKLGNNSIVINVTSGTLDIGYDASFAYMIRVILPITQPFKTTETTPDFASAINKWTESHNLTNITSPASYQWVNLSTNETGWIVPFMLHSNSSGAIRMTNLHFKATPSLEENLNTLLPDFIEYNVVFAYLDTITKGHKYTFSDGNSTNTSTFDGNESKTLSIRLPRNTTEVYIAKMIVSGSANGTPTAERVSVSADRQSDPCIAVNNSSAMLVWTEGTTSPTKVYSAMRGISAGPWSSAVRVNVSNPPQHSGTLGMNDTGAFVAWVGGAERINYTENGTAIGVNASTRHQTEPSLAVNSTGHVFLAWTENDSIYYSEYDHTAWSLAQLVNSSTSSQSNASLVANDSGWAFLAWVENDTIMYSEYNRTNWSQPENVSGSGGMSAPTLAVNNLGGTLVVWVNGTDANARLWCSARNRTSQSWQHHRRVHDNELPQTAPDLVTDSIGRPQLVWVQCGSIYYSDGINWLTQVRIADCGDKPTIAVNSSDAPHIAWEHDDEIWYVKGAVETSYHGNYPQQPSITVNNTKVWGYNITKINHNDTSTKYQTINNSSLTKVFKFNINETVEGPVILSMYANGSNSSFDVYVRGAYAGSDCMNGTTMWRNFTTSQNLWQRGDNEVRINVTSGCTNWFYDSSTDGIQDSRYNQTEDPGNSSSNTWMIRLYGHEYRGTQMIGNPNTESKFSRALNRSLNPNATSDQEINFTIHSTNGNLTLHTLRIYYYIRGNETEVAQTRFITHNVPPSDTVTVTRLVTIHDSDRPDEKEAEKQIPDTGADIPIANMVEVRLELWYR